MKTIVIGAGVAGLFFASLIDSKTLVIEKNEFAGRKLLATGNGRCNFTNLNLSMDNYRSENEGFYRYAIDEFDNYSLLNFFKELGVETTSLPSGRCYPKTMSSKTIRDILYINAKERAKFVFDEEVIDIDFSKKKVITQNNKYNYDNLVIATGGMTLKNSGSDGKIIDLLKNRIKICDMTYAITNYRTYQKLSKRANGVKVDAKASLFIEDDFIKSSTDDIIFKDYGLTGTAIFDISNPLSIALKKGQRAYIEIDFFPYYNKEEFEIFFNSLIKKYNYRDIKKLLIGIINEKLIDDILEKSKVNSHKKGYELSDKDKKNLLQILKSLRFDVSEIYDKENAQVTIGGIDTKYIDPKTMKSKVLEDVYFIGEIMDVAGDCGGYNIQRAFSSASIAAAEIRRLNV